MNGRSVLVAWAAGALALLLIAGCGLRGIGTTGRQGAQADQRGAILDKQLKGSASLNEVNAVAEKFLTAGDFPRAKFGVDWYRIEFQSLDRDGSPLRLVAQVFAPKTDQAATLPVYVFGPGTTGLNDTCAPSNEQPDVRSWGDFHSHMLTYAMQGYVAVVPDYEGFDDGPRLHHYYVGELQGRALLDAARAGLRFFDESGTAPAKPKPNPVFLAGYSNGGYAALAARDLAPKYAPELQVKGVIGYGPRSDVSTLFKEMPSLGPYVLYSYADYYGRDKVPFERIVQPGVQRTLERDVTTKCIDEIVGYYGADPAAVFTPEFVSALRQGTLAQQFPVLKQLFDQNKAGVSPDSKLIPVLVLHSAKDTVVEPATLQAYMKELCGAGGRGQYVAYPDIPHTLIRQTGYADAIHWIESITKGQLPKNDCL